MDDAPRRYGMHAVCRKEESDVMAIVGAARHVRVAVHSSCHNMLSASCRHARCRNAQPRRTGEMCGEGGVGVGEVCAQRGGGVVGVWCVRGGAGCVRGGVRRSRAKARGTVRYKAWR